ncbi:MAG: DUF1573 domain-containing protein [Bacteroidetes bacterium]|nr:MAG: DUF1573 domain-containing protein [Bacteroidota bacterium]
MKKNILSFAAAIFTAFVVNAQAPAASTATVAPENPNAPDAVYVNEVLDYGTIEYDADGTREFKFKNTGKEPLIIYSATGSCGCTVPTAPKEPIKPGETGSIKVHYDTKRVGSFEKTITVASNGKTASKTLKIKGTVKAAATPAATSTVSPTPGH